MFKRAFVLTILPAVLASGAFPASSSAQGTTGSGSSFIARYQARVSATQAEQPHWITPLVTVTPRLEQEIRTDFVRQINFKGGANDGKTTTFATPGLVIGRTPLTHDASGKPGRLGLTFGAGEQIAVTRFHSNNHDLVFTARMPF